MTVRRIIWAVLLLIVGGQFWAMSELVSRCNRRSPVEALGVGLQTVMNDGATLRVADRVQFSRDLSQYGIECSRYDERHTGMPGRNRIKCWQYSIDLIRMPYGKHIIIEFQGDRIAYIRVESDKVERDGLGEK